MLTDVSARNLKPTATTRRVADTGGLYLWVYPSGDKTWMYRSRVGGSAKWVTLGEYPQVTLAQARRKLLDLKERGKPESATVQDAYDGVLVRVRKDYKRPEAFEYKMQKYFLPVFGDRKLVTVTRVELASFFAKEAARAPVQANRVLTDVKIVFDHAIERGWIDESPVERLTRKKVGGREKSRSRVLNENELVRLIHSLRTPRFAPATRYVLSLMLLTGQRSGEIRGLTKAEVAGGAWTIPDHRTKSNVASYVTLPRLSARLISHALNELGSSPFGGMQPTVPNRALDRIGFEPKATPHDLRRTMATKMADLGVLPHVIEKCLNHQMTGVMAIYNRADYTVEKRAALRAWAKYLLSLRKKAPDIGASGA